MTWKQGAEQFLTALASADPTPGGGAAAAMAGAMGCALVSMALGTTLKRKSTPNHQKEQLQKGQQKISQYQEKLEQLMAQDAKAYEAYIAAYRLPKEDPARGQALQQALWQAALVPADTAALCQTVLEEIKTVEPLVAPVILSDVYCAQHLLKGSLACCVENIRVNLKEITDPQRKEKLNQQVNSFTTGINQ